MVSLWSVKERETALLMSDFYANLSQKKSVSQSLKESKLKMIKQHPYFWAGFVLNGSGI
jgi:CHAT domain-containing protein